MAKHTPGPWSLNDDASHPWVVECPTNFPGFHGVVCKVDYLPNGRLIAAAPDMAETLRQQKAWVQQWTEDAAAGLKPTAESLVKALADIEAALAKAGVA